MFDINNIINEKIQQAYEKGRQDLAQDIIEISRHGNNVPEWAQNMERIIDLCFRVVMKNEG